MTMAPANESHRRKEAMELLQQCQTYAVEASSQTTSLSSALRSLHRSLVGLRTSSSPREEPSLTKEFTRGESVVDLKSVDVESSMLESVTVNPENDPTEEQFLHNVAKELVNLDRVIFSVDEEVNGDDSLHGFDYENDCKWYEEAMEMISMVECIDSGNASRDSTDLRLASDDHNIDISRNDPERWVDRCLDICGYATSLEAAVDCLRNIVHASSASASSAPGLSFRDNSLKKGDTRPGLAAAVTSLRTIRRRLIDIPALNWEEGVSLTSIPKPYRNSILHLKGSFDFQRICHLCEYTILPLEYQHHNQQTYHQGHHQLQNKIMPRQDIISEVLSDRLVSESLSSLSMSVLPTLVSSACYAIDLPLPSWAAPKFCHGKLFQSAWRATLAENLLNRCLASSQLCNGIEDFPSTDTSATCANKPHVSCASSNHFQLLVKQMIKGGRSDIIVHHLYKCWKACDSGSIDPDSTPLRELREPRSILCRHLQLSLSSIKSKREVAMLSGALLRHCARQELPLSSPNSLFSSILDDTCTSCILPFLRELLLPLLSKDMGLAEAMVNFIILTPPTSYHRQQELSLQSHPVLYDVDRAVPRCLAQLLAEVDGCAHSIGDTNETDRDSDSDSEADSHSHHGFKAENSLLVHLFSVASVWCEDVFITRTDTLQQQYVTEFLLQPLESKQLNQDDLQRVLTDGTPLATMLVQGVTFRLDVSRSQSIRIDGMRVAEAMAKLLGQQLRFEELHPSSEDDIGIVEENASNTECKGKARRKKKKRTPLKRAPVVVDPDTEYFSDDNESSNSSSQSASSTDSHGSDESSESNSSWGEDSLEPYALDDDEEDLRPVPCPHTLRDSLAYLLTSENDDLAYDKHLAALTELPTVVHAQPLDLLDVVSTLVRVLLFLEDKFSMDQFATKRWDSLVALGIVAPLETCMILVGEMKGNISLGTRLEALSLLKCVAQELSGIWRHPQQVAISDYSDQEVTNCSTRLRLALNLHNASDGEDAKKDSSAQTLKTRRWRKPRSSPNTAPNRFGAVSVQMIYSLFAFLSQTRTDQSIWGGPIGEKFLSEFLKTLSVMLYCGSTYPSSALRVLATDLFDLAWSFHDAKCAEVRHAALLAIASCIAMLPTEMVIQNAYGMRLFLNHCSALDESVECRNTASLITSSIAEAMNQIQA